MPHWKMLVGIGWPGARQWVSVKKPLLRLEKRLNYTSGLWPSYWKMTQGDRLDSDLPKPRQSTTLGSPPSLTLLRLMKPNVCHNALCSACHTHEPFVQLERDMIRSKLMQRECMTSCRFRLQCVCACTCTLHTTPGYFSRIFVIVALRSSHKLSCKFWTKKKPSAKLSWPHR